MDGRAIQNGQAGIDRIFEIVNRVLLGVDLLPVEGHCDVVKGLIDE